MNYFPKNFALVNMVRSSLTLRGGEEQYSVESPKRTWHGSLDMIDSNSKHSKSMQ